MKVPNKVVILGCGPGGLELAPRLQGVALGDVRGAEIGRSIRVA